MKTRHKQQRHQCKAPTLHPPKDLPQPLHYMGGAKLLQLKVSRLSRSITNNQNGSLIRSCSARLTHATVLRGRRGILRCPLNESRKNVSSASTMPLSLHRHTKGSGRGIRQGSQARRHDQCHISEKNCNSTGERITERVTPWQDCSPCRAQLAR